MNNKTGFNRLGRRAGHRRAMLKNLVTSLIKHERISTTKAKAMEVRRKAEKMITRAKVDSVHNRREIGREITDKDMLAKLFKELGPRFISRAGGYTRILKVGQRFGDAAEMVILEFVEKTAKPEAEAPAKKEKAKAPTAKKDDAEPVAEKKAPAKKAAPKVAAKPEAKADGAEKAPAKKAAPKKAKESDSEAK